MTMNFDWSVSPSSKEPFDLSLTLIPVLFLASGQYSVGLMKPTMSNTRQALDLF